MAKVAIITDSNSGITQNEAHRAWCDAEANAYVYLELKKDLNG